MTADRTCPSLGAGGGYNSKIFLSFLPDSFLTSLLKVKEVYPSQTEVVNVRPPPGTLGRHANQVQHNLLSCAPLAMSDFTVMMKSKALSHSRRHCHLESCGRQNLLLMPHGPVGNALSGTFARAPTAVSLCKFSARSLALF